VTSALGILQVDLRHDILRSVLARVDQIDPDDLAGVFAELDAEAVEILEGEHIAEDRRRIERSIDVRYYGQTPYLNLPLDAAPTTRQAIARIAELYADQYEREFGYRLDADIATVEIVNARTAAVGLAPPAEFTPASVPDGEPTAHESRPVYFDEVGDYAETPVYARARLASGVVLDGPAIVEQMDTTVLIPPNSRVSVDSQLNLVVEAMTRTAPSPALATAHPTDRGA
jgi:N-methylhydantoinase A